MTSIERMYALYQATQYVLAREVPGAIVECGVWRGGSSMLAALTLERLGARDRELWLYDTFEGMAEPTREDGAEAYAEWARHEAPDVNHWCYGPIDVVRSNMLATGYPSDLLNLVQGKVEDTIPGRLPESIGLLRLDTDWYASTKHELVHLYPLLQPGGVLIIDDYGHWEGARRAVDEYLVEHDQHLLLSRIDYTGRIGIKA
jgi:hypothetical protein